jgi:spore coat polysaccharide biosynthesis predicted glycosyltransferase SpsG
VVVSLGSGDSNNVTLRVVQALQQGEISRSQVRVIVGPTNPHLETLQQAVSRTPNVQVLIDVADMPAQLAWADMAVSGGGSTCWELAFMGLPSILIVMAENQLRIAQALDEAKAAVNLGWHHQISLLSLLEEISNLQRAWETRREISDNARSLVDGKGASRVVEALRSRMNLGTEHAHSISG